MLELLPYLLVAMSAAAVAGLITYLLVSRNLNQRERQIAALSERLQGKEEELRTLQGEIRTLDEQSSVLGQTNTGLREQIARLQSELSSEQQRFAEKFALLEGAREQMSLQFKELANEILEDKSKRFTVSNQENIAQILKPLQEKIQHFEKRVEETYDKESKERFSLAREVKALQELNTRLSEDAVNLTNALKGDNKTQGTWGEMILESILEKSGLVKGREYEIQVSLKAADGSRSQPDVIVHMPGSKDIIIDAKVSLKAYEAYCNEDEPGRKADLLQQHIQSIRNHVKLLASKDYQNLAGVKTLDFILLFMPIEAAFSVAAQQDSELFMSAFEKNIIIVGPSTLLTTLRTVQNIWRMAQQNQNALEIASRAGALYDKFVGFVEDLEDIGGKIDATRRSYDLAHNKLLGGRGNLIGRVEKLKALGAKTSKQHSKEVLQAADLEMQQDALPGTSEVVSDGGGE
ncbi:MAG: DNA recombination protein RmuC [Gammaproteobacteria bacterium]|jgi:DNA recombination protein RmuC